MKEKEYKLIGKQLMIRRARLFLFRKEGRTELCCKGPWILEQQ